MTHKYSVGDKIRFIDDGDLLWWLIGKTGIVVEVLDTEHPDFDDCDVRASIVLDENGRVSKHTLLILREHCEPVEEDPNL